MIVNNDMHDSGECQEKMREVNRLTFNTIFLLNRNELGGFDARWEKRNFLKAG
jgi:hypothetical protein